MRNRTVLGILCIVASLFLVFGVTPIVSRGFSAKTTVVRMKSDQPAGTMLTKGMLEEAEVGKYGLPEGAVRTIAEAEGRYLTADVVAGDMLLPGKTADEPAKENEYLYHLDGKKQAMSITIKKFAEGVSGKLKSGDVVTVMATDFQKTGVTVIPTELKYVEVIAVTAKSGSDANVKEGSDKNKDGEEETRELPTTVTVLVTPMQGKILAMLEADGEMHLSLVYRGDEETAKRFIAEQDRVLAEIEEVLREAEPLKDEGDGEVRSVGADGTTLISLIAAKGKTGIITEGNRIATGSLPASASLGSEEGKDAGQLIRGNQE